MSISGLAEGYPLTEAIRKPESNLANTTPNLVEYLWYAGLEHKTTGPEEQSSQRMHKRSYYS